MYLEKAISVSKYHSNFSTESTSGNLLQDRITQLYSKTLIGVKSVTENIIKTLFLFRYFC